jgi:hypothetical protein
VRRQRGAASPPPIGYSLAGAGDDHPTAACRRPGRDDRKLSEHRRRDGGLRRDLDPSLPWVPAAAIAARRSRSGSLMSDGERGGGQRPVLVRTGSMGHPEYRTARGC